MSDIVTRLRNTPMLRSDVANGGLCREAADEIERLTAALEQAVDDFGEGHSVCEQTKQECIRALEPKP